MVAFQVFAKLSSKSEIFINARTSEPFKTAGIRFFTLNAVTKNVQIFFLIYYYVMFIIKTNIFKRSVCLVVRFI